MASYSGRWEKKVSAWDVFENGGDPLNMSIIRRGINVSRTEKDKGKNQVTKKKKGAYPFIRGGKSAALG